jgi:hypothetical protein
MEDITNTEDVWDKTEINTLLNESKNKKWKGERRDFLHRAEPQDENHMYEHGNSI